MLTLVYSWLIEDICVAINHSILTIGSKLKKRNKEWIPIDIHSFIPLRVYALEKDSCL